MIGQTVSHYKILEKLGEGGMGVVYKAHDVKLDRLVALKFLPPDLTRDTEAKQRFVHEAKAASALQHNNICVVYDIDQTDDGQMFISMEYLEGETLKKKIERGPLKIEEAVDIAVQVAQGFTKAHEHGIIHRDIKPANVMVTSDSVAKIVDFGLAKLSRRTMLTKAGSTLGTAGYMSPEQARGEETDNRTDIWSLGIVLYEMLTGLLPFKGEYEQGLIYQILNSVPAPITGVRSGIPLELEHIVNKCLEKKSDERYQTTADLTADLRHFQRVVGAGTDTMQRLSATAGGAVRRAKWWYWAVPALVIAIIAVVLFFEIPKRVTDHEEKSIAVLPFVDMSPQKDQDYFCDGITEELINRLSHVQDLRVPARTSAFTFKGKTEDVREIGSKLNVRTVLEGSVRKAGNGLRITAQLINVADGYHLWSETYDRELKDIFAIQDEISSAIVNALKLKLTSQETQKLSEHLIGDVRAFDCYLKAYRQIRRFDEKSLDSAFMYLQSGIDIMGDNALLYSGMAFACYQYANIGIKQEEYLKRAEEYAKKALALKPDLASALTMLGTLSYYEDYPQNLHDSFRYFRKAVAADPNDTRALSSLAQDYQQIGRFSESPAIVKKLERLDPLDPWWHILRGFGYQYDCQFGSALEEFRMYYRGDSTNPLAQTCYSWSLVYNSKGDEAHAVIDRIGKKSGSDVFTVFCLLLKYALLKDKESALRAMTPEFQKTCRRDGEWAYWVADRLSLLGAKEEALDWLESSVNQGFINYPLLQCDPFFDNIRGEEHYKKLMERAKYEWEHFEE